MDGFFRILQKLLFKLICTRLYSILKICVHKSNVSPRIKAMGIVDLQNGARYCIKSKFELWYFFSQCSYKVEIIFNKSMYLGAPNLHDNLFGSNWILYFHYFISFFFVTEFYKIKCIHLIGLFLPCLFHHTLKRKVQEVFYFCFDYSEVSIKHPVLLNDLVWIFPKSLY